MNKDFKYSGYSAVPSDYDCADGSLCSSLNLICEDGNVTPLGDPSRVMKLQEGETLLLIHNVHGQSNLILLRVNQSTQGIYWIKEYAPEAHQNQIPDSSDARFVISIEDFSDIAIMGNTLCIATSSGIQYLLWSRNNYQCLGSEPPRLSISFAAVERGTSIRTSSHTEIPFNLTDATKLTNQPEIGFRVADEYISKLSDAVHGLLNSQIAKYCTSRGYFWQPFFVRYAYRLYDGSHAWVSQPVLILTTTLLPIIRFHGNKISFGLESGTTLSPVCGLAYRITEIDVGRLAQWKDIIVGVDIFVSAPIYTYDTQSRISEFLFFRESQAAAPALADTINNIIYPGSFARPSDYSDPRDTPAQSNGFIDGVTPDTFPENVDFTYRDVAIPNDASVCYGDDYRLCSYAHFSPNYDFKKHLLAVNAFYHVHTYDIKEIKQMESYDWVKIDCSTDNTLRGRELLESSAEYPFAIVPQKLFVYNSRLHLSNLKLVPRPPMPLSIAVPYEDTERLAPVPAYTSVLTSYNGLPIFYNGLKTDSRPSAVEMYPSSRMPPRYYYYSDLNATSVNVQIGSTNYYLRLAKSDFINGSHFFAGCAPISQLTAPGSSILIPDISDSSTLASFASVPNSLRVSSVNNPFTYPVGSDISVGMGEILALSTAAKALSQGQFGQFPLYVFTSEGIWSLEFTSAATYSARQPITRDVCINPDAITQIDSAVLFPTGRGIMLISGSQTQCISDIINTDTPFDVRSLPGMQKIHDMLGHIDTNAHPDKCLPILPFYKYLKDCGMLYDYVHQRIIVYNRNCTYAYVYSLKSQLWGMMYSNIKSGINSYPDALAVDSDGNIVNFSEDCTENVGGLLVTRPLKLDAPDVHKTIDAIIQRGHFQKGHVQSVLYGSRDLFNWHLVWSSKDHFLRGFRGTPYKYFRIALLCDLAPGESIFGASIQFTPKLTNHLR